MRGIKSVRRGINTNSARNENRAQYICEDNINNNAPLLLQKPSIYSITCTTSKSTVTALVAVGNAVGFAAGIIVGRLLVQYCIVDLIGDIWVG